MLMMMLVTSDPFTFRPPPPSTPSCPALGNLLDSAADGKDPASDGMSGPQGCSSSLQLAQGQHSSQRDSL